MLSKNLPANASIIAKIINPIKINFLKCFDIFFDEVLTNNFSKK